MIPDLVIVFLVFLFLTGFLLLVRTQGNVLGGVNLGHVFLDFLLIPALLGVVASFMLLVFRIDPIPLIRAASYRLSLEQNVSYADAIPPNLADNLEVSNVERIDTDSDGFSEWVVSYKFDVRGVWDPIQVVVYDNDRGNPPILFPYRLRPPSRDYLGEGGVSLELTQIIPGENASEDEDASPKEILVRGGQELTIFRYEQNSKEWEPPTDDPLRYQPIGFFRGSGGVGFDGETKNVTVHERDGFERSQLVMRRVYEFKPATNSYFESTTSTKLAPPIVETIDFFPGPPDDILDTEFPEKIVLAFYASTCGSQDNTLCRNKRGIPEDYLLGYSPDAERNDVCSRSRSEVPADEKYDACREFQRENPGYFGLSSFNNMQKIWVKSLSYFPQLEETSSRSVYTGAQPQGNCVVIDLVGPDFLGEAEDARAFQMSFSDGRWKIARRIELGQCLTEAGRPYTPSLEPAAAPELGPAPAPAATQVPPSP